MRPPQLVSFNYSRIVAESDNLPIFCTFSTLFAAKVRGFVVARHDDSVRTQKLSSEVCCTSLVDDSTYGIYCHNSGQL